MFADQLVDCIDIVTVFFDSGYTKQMPVGVIILLGHGTPKNVLCFGIVPNFGQAKRQNENIGIIKQILRLGAHGLVITIYFLVVAVPKSLVERAVSPSPFKLLTDHERIHHSIANPHDVRVLRVGFVHTDPIIATAEPFRNVSGKTASKRCNPRITVDHGCVRG
jgi:hypothetical protein